MTSSYAGADSRRLASISISFIQFTDDLSDHSKAKGRGLHPRPAGFSVRRRLDQGEHIVALSALRSLR